MPLACWHSQPLSSNAKRCHRPCPNESPQPVPTCVRARAHVCVSMCRIDCVLGGLTPCLFCDCEEMCKGRIQRGRQGMVQSRVFGRASGEPVQLAAEVGRAGSEAAAPAVHQSHGRGPRGTGSCLDTPSLRGRHRRRVPRANPFSQPVTYPRGRGGGGYGGTACLDSRPLRDSHDGARFYKFEEWMGWGSGVCTWRDWGTGRFSPKLEGADGRGQYSQVLDGWMDGTGRYDLSLDI